MMWARVTVRNFPAAGSGEAHEIPHRVFVGTPGARVGEIGEPFDLGRHVGEAMKLGGGQQSVGQE